LDDLGLTYPQYLVLNVLWREDGQTVGGIAQHLALESSTLTPVLKRLETAGLIRRSRNPQNERQLIVTLTEQGHAMKARATCLAERLLEASGWTSDELAALNMDARRLRDRIYKSIGGWSSEEAASA
jgi:DNA-binding MarR family transcriptional regulator